MSEPRNKGYRRSWKNLLINKGYQLRFTLFMVGLSAVLMLFLGLWVMHVAETATTVGVNDVIGHKCPDVPPLAPPAAGSAAPAGAALEDEEVETEPEGKPEAGEATPEAGAAGKPAAGEATPAPGAAAQPGAGAAPTPGAAAQPGAGTAGAAGTAEAGAPGETGAAPGQAPAAEGALPAEDAPPDRRVVTVEVGELEPIAAPPVPPEFVKAIVDRYQCRMDQIAKSRELENGKRRILVVLIAVGLMLVVGLTIYGIKMTHKVAGPLYKLSLYFEKMREGTYGRIQDLRKGDQLVEFYDSFKAAHDGLRDMQERDISVLRSVLQAAERDNLAARSPELASALNEMRAILERKEKSLE